MKKQYFVLAMLFALALTLNSSPSLAGGSVVGNGAGLEENTFEYAYVSLPELIDNCILSNQCNTHHMSLLSEIRKIAFENQNLPQKLIFVSEKDSPGFFSTGSNEPHRIAKTALVRNSPIYLNSDLLYLPDGRLAIDFPTMVSILIHELGHQAGEPNHALLDTLGSIVKKSLASTSNTITVADAANKQNFSAVITNFTKPSLKANLRFIDNIDTDDSSSIFLYETLSATACVSGSVYIGVNVVYSEANYMPIAEGSGIKVNLVANAYCSESSAAGASIKASLKRVIIQTDVHFKVRNLTIQDLK